MVFILKEAAQRNVGKRPLQPCMNDPSQRHVLTPAPRIFTQPISFLTLKLFFFDGVKSKARCLNETWRIDLTLTARQEQFVHKSSGGLKEIYHSSRVQRGLMEAALEWDILIAGRLFDFIVKKACVWYENQFSALSSERLLRSIIQLGLQPTNNSCSALWKLVVGGGQAVHFLNNSCASTLVFGFNNARFSVSTRCPRAFSVWLFCREIWDLLCWDGWHHHEIAVLCLQWVFLSPFPKLYLRFCTPSLNIGVTLITMKLLCVL